MFSFTSTEMRELLLGTLLFVVVILSTVVFFYELIELLILGILIFPLFLFHELAHKFVAQGNGLYSEFRLYPNLALISLVSILFPFKIIAPGVVLSSGQYNTDVEARISMAGPTVNILLGGIFLFLSALAAPDWRNVIWFVSHSSFYLALFNLLPLANLDGSKIYQWHTGVYGVIFGMTVILWIFHPLGILGGGF